MAGVIIYIYIKNNMKVDLVIPSYNEDAIFPKNAKIILDFLNKSSFAFDWRLVFVVNGSSRAFENMVADFAAQNPDRVRAEIIEHSGKGRAIKTYFNQSEADVLAYMDMDLAVSLDNIPDLLAPVLSGQTDLCFGSRMLPGSARSRSWLRELNSQFYIFLSQLILGHHFSDLQCGFKAITRQTWRAVAPKIKNDYWFFDTELIYYVGKVGGRIKEIPINWSENRYEKRKSKVNIWKDGLVFLREMIKLRLGR